MDKNNNKTKKSSFYKKVVSYEELLELINSAQNGNIFAKNKLIKLNTGLVNKAVLKYLPSGLEREDLFQIGCIGLIKAIDRFDASLGYMFSSYAVPMIEGEILRFLRDDGLIKISREFKDINWKVKKYKDFRIKRTGKEPNLDELSRALDIPKVKIKAALIALSPIEFFNTYDSENGKLQLDPANTLLKEENIPYTDIIELNEIIDELPEIERKVMKLRYFDDLTQEKVGQILGMSQVQVSRIERKAIQKLKKEYTN